MLNPGSSVNKLSDKSLIHERNFNLFRSLCNEFNSDFATKHDIVISNVDILTLKSKTSSCYAASRYYMNWTLYNITNMILAPNNFDTLEDSPIIESTDRLWNLIC